RLLPRWIAEPQGRGTAGILLNCFCTLSICVWTALHLNIDIRPLFWDRLLITAKYVALGIFWPETVLYTASGQWIAARGLVLGHGGLTMEVTFYPDSDDSDSSEEIMLSYNQLKRHVEESLLTKATLKNFIEKLRTSATLIGWLKYWRA
ncbi:hypothetical protein RUND412_002876, partial [Rhizina undulata]